MKISAFTTLFVAVSTVTAAGWAGEPDDVAARLARAPKPWSQSMHRITPEEYEGTLKFWAERDPQRVRLEKRAETLERMPIYLLRISDAAVSDEDKQL